MNIDSIIISFYRGYESTPGLSIANDLHYEKFILINYFFSNYSTAFLIDRFIREIEETNISILEFEIGYGAGCLYVNNGGKVFFETFGDDPNAMVIEMSYLNFKKLCVAWKAFICSEQEQVEYECKISNTYHFLCERFEDQSHQKYNLFKDFYLRNAKITKHSQVKLQALAYYITDRDNSIQRLLDEINIGKKDVSVSYFIAHHVGILTFNESTLNFQAFEGYSELESFEFTILEFQEVISEWKSFINGLN